VLAELGHAVTGIDLSPAMISLAEAKAAAAGYPIAFQIMDAAFPQFPLQLFDVLVCRHLLWALPEPAQVLRRWIALLKPGGRLVLVEGYWKTDAGLHAHEIVAALPPTLINVAIQDLSDQPDLWGGAVSDERYAISADLQP
jgi:SAM-dependent methyltransferase